MGCGASKNIVDTKRGMPLAEMHAGIVGAAVTESAGLVSQPISDSAAHLQVKKPVLTENVKAAPASLEGYAAHAFWGAVADKYCERHGLPAGTMKDPYWVKDAEKADKVAAAILDWATEHGASTYCHWFQPMCAQGRHGMSGQVQLGMFEFDKDNCPKWDLEGKHLLQGETDGSSFPNGGLRATHTAGGYLTIDPSSQIWLRGDSIFIPACFVSYEGKSLDEKVPLLRAEQALSREGARLFKLLGHEIEGLFTNIGLEQELFFVPTDAYYKRPDLQMCGRTVLGKAPALDQEGCTHYMAPINTQKSVFNCMKEIQEECYKVGIPLKTRHREVAPNQYEFAPCFGPVQQQIDQNLVAMQICEEVAPKYGLRTILQEKPFQGVNGSGKHNNWSISTKCGAQLLNPGDLTKKMKGDAKLFPIVMAAIVSAVDAYGDLMRMSISCPGNDFRLGAMEAPPAVMSAYLGKQMTEFLEKFMNGEVKEYKPTTTDIDLGVPFTPTVVAPSEDRNRTSPFPYGGHRFEFRACGSSQNVSLINTVLGSIVAAQFKLIADRVEKGEDAVAVAQELLKKHMKSVYNGNGYDPAWPKKAEEKGLWVIPSGVDAILKFTDEKNTKMFEELKVLGPEEVKARQTCLLEQYLLTVETECKCMIDMIKMHVIPSCKASGLDDKGACEAGMKLLEDCLGQIHAAELQDAAKMCRTLRLETMIQVRKTIDELEGKAAPSCWTLASYKDLWFIDQNS
eukprot:CAMPEP_0118958484 /NCGR_PEP_ID=MMETSP1169-20130426/62644_1 /TAXON_ID=36882 /ORGANISM="Pyramimonas obovata, Strain CCMP722" /LENGTH=736 /DNA_ID=CAMNT_0006906601 /DNA_START=46 /DNA_END=2256 /DNA_ORIENTATION=-